MRFIMAKVLNQLCNIMAVGCDCLNILVFLVAETKGKLTGIAYY